MAVYDINGNEVVTAVETDTTLTESGVPADAKVTGDLFEELGALASEGDLPMVFISGTLPTSKADGELSVEIEYRSKTKDFNTYGTLKVQGDSSTSYPKKNFTVKLFSDSRHTIKNKMTFRDWDKRNKFVMKANWIDHSHARNVVNARLWSQIVKSRSDFESLPTELKTSNLAIDGFPVRVFNNGVYLGLYTWNLPKDGMYNVDDKVNENCIINSEMNNDQSCAFNGTSITNWSDELHDSMPYIITTGWTNVLKFVSTSSDADFTSGINSYIDLQSIIDFDIFARVICLVDNLCKNQIFFTYNGTKWYEGAYDLDGTWGLPPTNRSWFAYNTVFQDGYIAYADFGVENKLYTRVETLFKSQFKTRYSELRNSVLSADNIILQFELFVDQISNDLYKEDFASTTANGAYTQIPFTSQNNIQQIRKFVVDRLAYMDSQILT